MNKSIHSYQVIVGNIGIVLETTNGFIANREYGQWIQASKADGGRASGEDVTLMRDNEPWREYCALPQYFAEITDTYGGEANYCWVHRYLINAKTFSGAVRKLTQETGYRFRKAYDTGESRRYNVSGACICAFIQWSDPSDREYSHLKTL